MGVDLNKQKQKKEDENRKAAERAARLTVRNVKRWKPNVGDSRVRIMPPWTSDGYNADNWANEVYLHWGVPGVEYPILCVTQTPGKEGSCAICDLVDNLRASQDPADNEMAKDLRAKSSYDANIVNLKDPVYKQDEVDAWEEENQGQECPFTAGQTKIQVWTFGTTIYKQLLDIFADGTDITDIESGFDVIITREGKTRETTKYRLRIDTKPSSFQVKGDINLMEKLVNLDLLHQVKDPGEIKALLNGDTAPATKALPPKSEDEEEEAAPPAKKVEKKPESDESDVDQLEKALKNAVKKK